MALVYALLISGALCVAGLAGDLMRSLFRRSERGVWLLVLIVSSVGPIAVLRWAQHEPTAFECQRLSLPTLFVAEGADEQSVEAGGRQGTAVPMNSVAGVETLSGRTVRADFEWLRADSPRPWPKEDGAGGRRSRAATPQPGG